MAKIDELLQELCPEGVEWKTFSDCCSYIRGITYNKSQESKSDDGVKVLRANNITLSNNSLNFADVKVVDNSVKIKDSQWLKQSDILICAGSGSKEHIGKVAFVPNDLHYTFGGFMGVIRSKCFVQQSYLFHLLKSTIFSDYLNASLNSSTINNLSASIMSNFSFPLPPIPIQQYIVEVLDTFTDAISNLEEELALREKQFEYYREQLLSFDDENSWGKQLCSDRVEWKTLGEIGSIVRGKRFCHRDAVDVGIPCIHYGEIYTYYGTKANVTKSFVDESLASKLRFAKKGDVVIVGAGENDLDIGIGVAYLGDDLVAVHDACYTLSNHNMNPLFISYWLRTNKYHKQIRMYVSSAKICSLSNEGLKKAFIPVPPLSVQQEIVEILDTFEAMIANIKEEIALRTKQYEYYREKLLSFGK